MPLAGAPRARTSVEEAVAKPAYDEVAALAPSLLAAARLILRDDADARDVVQTTSEIALRRLSSLRQPERLLSWLLTIQTREAFRMRRRMKRFVTTSHLPDIPSPSGVDDSVIALRQAVGDLPLRMRTAVVIHHMVGLSVAETASAMGISENSVKSELKVGLERLREVMR